MLNDEEIKKDLQRITMMKKDEGWNNFPSEKDDQKKIEKNNVTFALNVLYAKNEKIYLAYTSKHNSNREKQVILLMILNREKQWGYLAVKKLSALLRRITSKHHGDFYCLNCLHSFAATKTLESNKKLCENKNVIMPSEDTKIVEFNQYQKSGKTSLIIYGDLDCIIERNDGCKNNSENSFTTKVSKNSQSGFSMSTISSCRSI